MNGSYAPLYVQKVPQYDSGQTGNPLYYFDDLVSYKERWQMRTDWDAASCSAGAKYIYVAEYGNNRVQLLNQSGTFIMGIGAGYNGVSGSIGSSGTGNGQFNCVEGIAMDSNGNLWVVDLSNNRVQKFNSSGSWLASLGGTSSACSNCLCTGPSACPTSSGSGNGQFNGPFGIAIDSGGNIWVADQSNNRLEEFSSAGSYLAQFGNTNPNSNQVSLPSGVTFDASGNLWAVSTGDSGLDKCTTSGNCTYINTSSSTLCCDYGSSDLLARDASGNIWVSNEANHRVDEYSVGGSYLGTISGLPNLPGRSETGVAFDSSGNLWMANEDTNLIYEYNTSGTLLKTIGSSGSGNGQFTSPQAIVFGGR